MHALKRLMPLPAAIGLTVGGTLTGSPAFAAAPLLKSNLNGRCADVFMFHQENGASTVTWDCTGNTNQQWRWDGEQIRSGPNGKCLEIYGFHPGDQGSVSMWDCTGGSNQKWFRNGNEVRSRAGTSERWPGPARDVTGSAERTSRAHGTVLRPS